MVILNLEVNSAGGIWFDKTSRERHKSAPYLRLKIAKRHESVKKFKISNSQKEYQTHEKPKRPNWRARCVKRWTLLHFSASIVAKHQKIE